MKRSRRKQGNFLRVTGLFKSRRTPENARFSLSGRVSAEYLKVLRDVVDEAYRQKGAVRFCVTSWRDSDADAVLTVAYDEGAGFRGRRGKYDDDEDEDSRRRPPRRGRARRDDDDVADEHDTDDLFDDDDEDADDDSDEAAKADGAGNKEDEEGIDLRW